MFDLPSVNVPLTVYTLFVFAAGWGIGIWYETRREDKPEHHFRIRFGQHESPSKEHPLAQDDVPVRT